MSYTETQITTISIKYYTNSKPRRPYTAAERSHSECKIPRNIPGSSKSSVVSNGIIRSRLRSRYGHTTVVRVTTLMMMMTRWKLARLQRVWPFFVSHMGWANREITKVSCWSIRMVRFEVVCLLMKLAICLIMVRLFVCFVLDHLRVLSNKGMVQLDILVVFNRWITYSISAILRNLIIAWLR